MLLTACIAPKPGVREKLHRIDPAVRLADYQRGLKFWLELSEPRISGIVFAENSGYPLNAVRAVATQLDRPAPVVEFLSFDFPPPPEGLSLGYSEFQLVNRVVRESRLLAGASHFVKATGRYTFPDFSRLLRRLPADFDVALDCKGVRPFKMKSNPMAPVALALFARDFYQRELAQLVEQMVPAPPWNRQQFIEHLLFDKLFPLRADPRIVLRWPCNCDPHGIVSTGDSYQTSRKRLQQSLRAVGRRVFPGLWI